MGKVTLMFDALNPETNLFNASLSDWEKGVNNVPGIDPLLNNTQTKFSRGSGLSSDYFLQPTVAFSVRDIFINSIDFNQPEITESFYANDPENYDSLVNVLTGAYEDVYTNNSSLIFESENANLNTGFDHEIEPDISIVSGTLRADRFSVEPENKFTVISGNGNVDFGKGAKDVLDLSDTFSSNVKFDFASLTEGGVVFNPGNGDRVFDTITLNNGNQILFEGIDTIQFADGAVNLSTTPNDPLFDQQWNLHIMGVHNAWRFTTGSEQVLIGVQDTGLGFNYFDKIHPDLKNVIGYMNNVGDDFSDSNSSHGTAVHSIISANTNNGIGMSGINWNSTVFNIDVLGGDKNDQTLVEATKNMIAEAEENNQNLVINMSLGTATFGVNYHASLAKVIADNPDVLFVISAGNRGNLGKEGIASPAILAEQYDNVIAVGASWGTEDANGYSREPGQRIEYSGWWGSQYGSGLTLMGPSEVVSARASDSGWGGHFNYQTNFNGTSASAPNVAGVASLVWSANENLTAANIKQILSETAYDLGSSGYDMYYGHGFVNADAAVRRALVANSENLG